MQIKWDTVIAWDDARLILLLTRLGSLKKAAGALKVHVSTVSRRLDILEKNLAVQLFDRTTEGVLPTAAVERLLPFAEAMEQNAFGLSHALAGFEAEPEGIVRITAPPSMVDHFLVQVTGELIQRYPKIQLELSSSVQMADLTRREADIALRTRRPTVGDLMSVALMPEIPSHLYGAAPRVLSRRGFLESYFVTYASELEFLPECQWILRHVPHDKIVVRTSSLTAQVEAVRSGFGVVLLAEAYDGLSGLHRLELKPDLKRRLSPMPTHSLFLVAHRALRQVPRIAATWDFLRSRFTWPETL